MLKYINYDNYFTFHKELLFSNIYTNSFIFFSFVFHYGKELDLSFSFNLFIIKVFNL